MTTTTQAMTTTTADFLLIGHTPGASICFAPQADGTVRILAAGEGFPGGIDGEDIDDTLPIEEARDLYRALRAEGWVTEAENAEGEAEVEADLAIEAAAAREPYSDRESEADCREYDAQRA